MGKPHTSGSWPKRTPPACHRCPETLHDRDGGQAQNRTADTRIFSTGESRRGRQGAEDGEGVSEGPTEPPSPTEPIPNPSDRFQVSLLHTPNPLNDLRLTRPNQDRTATDTAARSHPVAVPAL